MSQAVHDLRWVINSPSFVAGANVAPAVSLDEAAVDAEALQAFLDARPVHRVGRYFENLLHYWLLNIRKVEMIGAGVQIREGKRTIGELDFIYRDEAGAVVHCEAAVKFFLHHERPGASHFPGPNASDDFEQKTAKLFDKQLEFSRAHYPEVDLRHAFVKGIVFYRGDVRCDVLPSRMAPDHLRGSWIRSEELASLRERDDVVGSIAQKPHWLAPCATRPRIDMPALADQLGLHFRGTNPHPVMLSLCDRISDREVDRLFVVSKHWPNTPQTGTT